MERGARCAASQLVSGTFYAGFAITCNHKHSITSLGAARFG
jgi:hypothetical protein